MEYKEKLEALTKLGNDFMKKVKELAKEKGHENGVVNTDGFQKEQLETMKEDILKAMDSRIPKQKKILWGGDAEAQDGEVKYGMGKFMLMAKYNDPRLTKTVMSEGTEAQGGYTVPTGFSSEILGVLNDTASIVPKTTPLIHTQADGFTKNLPKWLTDLTVAWIAEATRKTTTKPTLTRKQSILKKLYAIVTATDEYLKMIFLKCFAISLQTEIQRKLSKIVKVLHHQQLFVEALVQKSTKRTAKVLVRKKK